MITLNTNKDILIQIHRNHVSKAIPNTCQVRLTGYLNENILEVEAQVQTLTNCYILSVTDDLTAVGMNAQLEILVAGEVAFESDAFILHPADNIEDDTSGEL